MRSGLVNSSEAVRSFSTVTDGNKEIKLLVGKRKGSCHKQRRERKRGRPMRKNVSSPYPFLQRMDSAFLTAIFASPKTNNNVLNYYSMLTPHLNLPQPFSFSLPLHAFKGLFFSCVISVHTNINMLGGNQNSQVFPILMEENRYDASGSTQMQLFQVQNAVPNGLNFAGDFLTTTGTNPTREPELNSWQQRFPICVNNSFHPEEGVNTSATILNINPVSTGLRLSYEEEELNNSSITNGGESIKAVIPCIFSLSDGLRTEMGRQKEELDHYIRIQEANMIKGIRQLGQRQTASFLNVLERGIGRKLQEKEYQMENINRMNKELEERIKQVSIEAQSWHYRANYNEAVVNNLKNNIQQVMMASSASQAKEGYGDSEMDNVSSSNNQLNKKCRGCECKEICILLLPCRHLCLCMDCDLLVDKCPVCNGKKSASLEVYVS